MFRLLIVISLFFAAAVQAGTPCTKVAAQPEQLTKAIMLSLQVQQELERLQPQLALLARVGADVSRYGLKYTHMGFVLRDHPKGRWLVVHALNVCETQRSTLYDEGLLNFFTDNPFEYRVLIAIPQQALQKTLVTQILAGQGRRLHQPNYNMLAYPFATRYQNSNQWLLEILAASIVDKFDISRSGSQRLLQQMYYRPDTIRLGPLQQLGASLFRANVAFDDHPIQSRRNGQYAVVTARSIVRFLRDQQLLISAQELSL